MIDSLGIEMGQERAAYFTDTEYAAALLDTRPEAIAEVLAQDPRAQRSRPPAQRRVVPLVAVAEMPDVRKVLIVWVPFAVGLLVLALLVVFGELTG